MAEFVKEWNDGGSLSATYEGSGDGSAVFSSDSNEGKDRSMIVTFVDQSGAIRVERSVSQSGRRQAFRCTDGRFILVDGGTFNVIKDGLQ